MYVFVTVCCCSGLVITMVASLLFILLLRYTAGALLWLIIVGVITAVAYGEFALKTVTHARSCFILNTYANAKAHYIYINCVLCIKLVNLIKT